MKKKKKKKKRRKKAHLFTYFYYFTSYISNHNFATKSTNKTQQFQISQTFTIFYTTYYIYLYNTV